MAEKTYKFECLNSNVLKLIALVTMTIDHVGVIMFPQYEILRIIGRIAFPIFAYMISEGCYYTRHKKRYLGELLIIGGLCQVVYYLVDKSMNMCILITFALSVMIIFAIQWAKKRSDEAEEKESGGFQAAYLTWLLPAALVAGAYIISVSVPGLVGEKYFSVDYGFVGIMIPVLLFLAQKKWLKLPVLAGSLIILAAVTYNPVQWWALLALIPLVFYNGKRGRLRIGQIFYIYYPLHLGVLWGIKYALLI